MKKNDERDETQLNLKPGEVYVEGDPLVFASPRAREIFYHPPDLTGCPFKFGSLEAADRYFHPEQYAGNDAAPQARPTAELLRPDEGNAALVQQAPVEVEILSPGPQIPGFFPGVGCGPIQVTGGIHLYEREPSKVQPAQPSAPKIQHPRSPTPMDMEEKLIRLERFAIYERNLHHYSEEKGVYEKIDRDAAKAIIRNRLKEDLRVRGTANQIQEVYEFLRLDERLKVNSAPPKHLLAFTNGVLNLRTGVFTAGHSPDLFLTWRLEIPYQAGNHSCPIFDSVVQQISGGDPVFIARVFEVLGYLLVPSSFMKGIVLFQGLSGAGKSVLSRLIATYFDPSIIAHIAVALFENRFAPATLEGCRLSSSMDLPGGKIKAEAIAMLKQITGGDAIFVETKGVDGHSAHLDCRFLFGTNHAFVPAVHDEAFIDRIILLPFRFAVPTEMVDQDLDDKLLPERSAIFNLALEAFYRLQRNHFQFTGEERYGIRTAGIGNSEADPMMALFLEECCVLDPVGQVPSSTLFDAYNAYLASHGQSFAGTSQQFSRVFNEATPPTVVPKKIRINSKPTNCYVGVKLKEESHEQ